MPYEVGRETSDLNRVLTEYFAGLAEVLRSEFVLYDIAIHIFFPGTILSPGYERENITKPAITKKLEETDDGLSPEACAKGLIQGKLPFSLPSNQRLLSTTPMASALSSLCHLTDLVLVGVEAGHFHITCDLLSNIFRASTRGNTPQSNFILDRVYSFFGFVSTSHHPQNAR